MFYVRFLSSIDRKTGRGKFKMGDTPFEHQQDAALHLYEALSFGGEVAGYVTTSVRGTTMLDCMAHSYLIRPSIRVYAPSPPESEEAPWNHADEAMRRMRASGHYQPMGGRDGQDAEVV